MLEGRNLFSTLEDGKMREGRSPAARAALARWSERTPELAGLHDPLTLVQRCHERDGDAARFLPGVLREADRDRWAERTMLQVVIPGLRAVARRARERYLGEPGSPWESWNDLEHAVVEIALERIRLLAPADVSFPCRTIVDQTWQRIRHQGRTSTQEAYRWVELERAEQRGVASGRSHLEELAALVVAAAEEGVLDRFDAGLVYSFHVIGYRIEELAELTGRSERTLWRRRRNAERLLAMFATHGLTGGGVRHPSPARRAGRVPLSVRQRPEAGVKGSLCQLPAALDSVDTTVHGERRKEPGNRRKC